MPYPLRQVLASGRIHPFYNSNSEYPPSLEAVQALQAQESDDAKEDIVELNSFNILWKNHLSNVIDRLVNDLSPKNSYRLRGYMSITGGGSGTKPMPFMTDVYENRKQRAEFGQFIRKTGLIEDGDWLLTTAYSGDMYRSLDLTAEIMENAGASVLAAGNYMACKTIVQHLQIFNVNVLLGESNQIMQMAHYISTLGKEERALIKLNKIIFTSETLSRAQRTLIRSVLGEIEIFSVLGSTEGGVYAIHNPNLTGSNDETSVQDFVFDSRSIKIEVFPTTLTEGNTQIPNPLPDGEEGLLVLTSLSKLRNPLIRYNTGDIGSIHAFPETARRYIADGEWQSLRVLRLKGRDRRFWITWEAVAFENTKVTAFMEQKEFGILQWQVIVDQTQDTKEGTLELRLMCAARGGDGDGGGKEEYLPYAEIEEQLRDFFVVFEVNEHRFSVVFVDDISQFERSVTGRKIIKFVDRINRQAASV